MRALGLDLGSKRVGVAISDSGGAVATPIDTIHRSRDRQADRRRIAELVAEWEAEIVVVGLPLSLDGSIGPAAQGAIDEAGALGDTLSVPVVMQDERLTTVTAHDRLREQGLKGPRRTAVVDQTAAAVLLQAWLDARRNQELPRPVTDVLDDQDYEYEELRPQTSTKRKLIITAVGALAVIALIAGGVSYWAYHQLHPGGSAGAEVIVDVPTGSSNAAIADLLEKKGVIGNAFVFKTWLKAKGASGIQAGQYKMAKHQDADEVLRTLKAGPLQKPSVDLTVLPGSTVREVPTQIVKYVPAFSTEALTQLIAADQAHSIYEPPGKGLEGFLFPDTYRIAEGADEATVLQTMLTQFDKVAGEVGLDQAQATAGVDPYSALIVASLVEKEAKVDDDRAKIARVIYNRLASGTPLGVDASLCYLKDEKPCVLHQSDLDSSSPYNTRKVVGLPPTPISNVTRASLDAALHPADGDWTYYVLDPDLPAGQHLFTSSASEFAAAKARCKSAGLGCD